MDLKWYLQRARAMGPGELFSRLRQRSDQVLWRRRYHARKSGPVFVPASDAPGFHGGLARTLAADAPGEARNRLIAAADALLAGKWPTFAVARTDVTPGVDWHLDVKSGKRLSHEAYTFDIRTHGSDVGFDTKYVWELSRHHHSTVLAMAYWLTGEARYAEAATDHISGWCAANPFLHGVHWSSGIELGMRLIAFTWTRRLLEDWPDAERRFEGDPMFRDSVCQHQWWLARRMSSGSSANNHLIYEATGLYVSACAMPWSAESARYRRQARTCLAREFRMQTFASGLNRELGTGYNGYVFEALALCLIEGATCGDPWPDEHWTLAADILNRIANFADCNGHPPNQGDNDDAVGLLLDAPDWDRWSDLLQLGAAWCGAADWWPSSKLSCLRAWLWSRIVAPPPATTSKPPPARSSVASDAGLAILRMASNTPDEIYCVFDAGPLGYLSIAAHGHADALAIELRVGGQPILIDPGTFNYVTERRWRDYFRSTAAHNTIELGEVDQSQSGGPFLWNRHARAQLLFAEGLAENASVAIASAEHDGYADRAFGGMHRREVRLDRSARRLEICDEISVRRPILARLRFHLHPKIVCDLAGCMATLRWNTDGAVRIATMELPVELAWRCQRGSEYPIEGWYAPSYDVKLPTTTLVGEVQIRGAATFRTSILANRAAQ